MIGLQLRMTPVEDGEYDAWVGRQGKPRYILTLLARRLEAAHLAAVASILAEQGMNIDIITRNADNRCQSLNKECLSSLLLRHAERAYYAGRSSARMPARVFRRGTFPSEHLAGDSWRHLNG